MKKTARILIGMLVMALCAALMVGCDSGNKAVEKKAADVKKEVAEAGKQAKEAVKATADWMDAKQKEFAAASRGQLNELGKQLQDFEAKAKAESKQKWASLKADLNAAEKKLDEAQVAGADKWDAAKADLEKRIDSLKKAIADLAKEG